MNFTKLFEMQRQLDARIAKEKGLEGQDLLSMKILALQVELGELANEWRGFKFWSNDQEPRYKKTAHCYKCDGEGTYLYWNCEPRVHKIVKCEECDGKGEFYKKPLLEEYVDCLHFILSIGLECRLQDKNLNTVVVEGIKLSNITKQFNFLFTKVGDFSIIKNHNNYMYIVPLFIGLGEMLGFTWEEIEQAYFDKNEINHQRQEDGY